MIANHLLSLSSTTQVTKYQTIRRCHRRIRRGIGFLLHGIAILRKRKLGPSQVPEGYYPVRQRHGKISKQLPNLGLDVLKRLNALLPNPMDKSEEKTQSLVVEVVVLFRALLLEAGKVEYCLPT
ncbi:Ff.00g065040.m01.CDS01 [Fusarium sp. VM40]|nr:Ff.00g065040.m01.CDS01 [Fusarium sp. VM40]